MVSVPTRRQQVAHARSRGVSCRRACALFEVSRSALGYRSRMAAKDSWILTRMRAFAARFPRWGYRRIRVLLRREGIEMSNARAFRLWSKAELQVPKKRKRKRVAASRPRPQSPAGPNQVWAYDFVFDACANKQTLKCLTVIDEWTREALCIEVASSIRASRVIDVLARLVSLRGAPKHLRSDNGPEFVSLAVLGWLEREGIETAFIAPGKPSSVITSKPAIHDHFKTGHTEMTPRR